jgi:hypothetical protein
MGRYIVTFCAGGPLAISYCHRWRSLRRRFHYSLASLLSLSLHRYIRYRCYRLHRHIRYIAGIAGYRVGGRATSLVISWHSSVISVIAAIATSAVTSAGIGYRWLSLVIAIATSSASLYYRHYRPSLAFGYIIAGYRLLSLIAGIVIG